MFIALDAGTSGVKAAAFAADGRLLDIERGVLGIERPRPGWAEQDMDRLWWCAAKVLAKLAARTGTPDFIAITGQGDGCWLVDAALRPVRPAILWNDARAAATVSGWLADGTMAKGYALNGSVVFPGLANAILVWLAAHAPETLARSAAMLTCSGWINARLTGTLAAEVSDAAAPFLDARTMAYSDGLLELYGLSGHRHLLPPIVSGRGAVAPLAPEAAARLDLPSGLPIVLAPYDVPAAALGAGAVSPGDTLMVLGTTFLCGTVTDTPVASGGMAGSTIALGPQRRYLRFFPTLSGMEVLGWAARLMGLEDGAAVAERAFAAGPGPGPTFLPYLSPAGERAPFLDPAARGTLSGLSLEHGRDTIAYAIVEGLTLALVDCLVAAGRPEGTITLSGGGAYSDPWCQLISDACDRPVRRAATAELTLRGAAIAGLAATGHGTVGEIAAAWQSAGDIWRPQPRRAAALAARYTEFRRLRNLARAGWHGEPAPEVGQ